MPYASTNLQRSGTTNRLEGASVVATGFYFRHNAGDDVYATLLPSMFPGIALVTCDDISKADLSAADTLVCGGGDIVNSYFMSHVARIRAHALAQGRALRLYALSVGIPYASEAHYLGMFDHVFVRSDRDYEVAAAAAGPANVTRIWDMAYNMRACRGSRSRGSSQSGTSTSEAMAGGQRRPRIGVCLAQPMFHGNAHKAALVAKLAGVADRILAAHPGASLVLLPFNTIDPAINASESDLVILCDLMAEMGGQGNTGDSDDSGGEEARAAAGPARSYPHAEVAMQEGRVGIERPKSPGALLAAVAALDVALCSRYHSLVFSAVAGVPPVALHCSQKIRNTVRDLGCASEAVEMRTDDRTMPLDFDDDALFAALERQLDPAQRVLARAPTADEAAAQYRAAAELIRARKERCGLASGAGASAQWLFDDALGLARTTLTALLGAEACERMLGRETGNEAFAALSPADLDAVARLVCFACTDCPDASYLWGLRDNMRAQPGFNLTAAMKWIYNDFACRAGTASSSPSPAPAPVARSLAAMALPVPARIDPFYKRHGTSGPNLHRAGWQYVVQSLKDMPGARPWSDRGALIVDTFLDRTFLWCERAYRTAGVLPYVEPWMGFIHHTFDQEHSTYNAHTLIATPSFADSLACCRGLIVLSDYLKAQLRAALDAAGHAGVPIFSLKHPVLTPERKFDLARFEANPRKRLVQVGAWLRRPFSIYRLRLPDREPLLRKSALKCSSMDLYFRPPGFHDELRRLSALPDHNGRNKYVLGAFQTVIDMGDSVEVLERLNDAEYDALLCENVAFLDLDDASACNTVLECLVANTPLIVNRHPAVAEYLGADYPGFYDDLDHAAALASDPRAIAAMHAHLERLDHEPYTMRAFLEGFADAVGRACARAEDSRAASSATDSGDCALETGSPLSPLSDRTRTTVSATTTTTTTTTTTCRNSICDFRSWEGSRADLGARAWVEEQVRFWYGDSLPTAEAGDWARILARIRRTEYGEGVRDMLSVEDQDAERVRAKYGTFGEYRFRHAAGVVREFVELDAAQPEGPRFTARHRFPVFMVDCVGPDAPLIAYTRSVNPGRAQAVLWPLEYHLALSKPGLADAQPFAAKRDAVAFRGALSGPVFGGTRVQGTPKSCRLDIVSRWRGEPWADLAISIVPGAALEGLDAAARARLEACMGDTMPTERIMRHKYVMCIEGADVSSGFGWVLASNCVPLHPYPFCYEVWFFNGLLPWVHFVPLRTDGSDLGEAHAWCVSHPGECEQIAAAGREHMRRMLDADLMREVKSGVVRLWDLQGALHP
jgi:hypothetical protein